MRMGFHRLAILAVATITFACCAPPAPLDVCLQNAGRSPLPATLVAFLPTVGRGQAAESADALIEDGTVSLARRPPYELPLEPTWREDPFEDPTWVYEYQSLFFVMDALLTYQATGEDKYLDVAQVHIDRWLAVHSPLDFRAAWGDHIMANRTRILLLAWELLRARDPESETVDGVCRLLARHGEHLSNSDEYTANHNHGFFQDEALLSLAVAFEEHPHRAVWLELALERLAAQIDFAVTKDGVHREHSPSYHAGMQMRFASLGGLLDSLGLSLRIDLTGVVERMYEFISYAALPTGQAPLLGDSSPWFGSTRMPGITDAALYTLSRGQSGSAADAVDRVFFESGYAFFRDAWHPAESFDQTVYVGFVAAVFSRAHKHCDDLSVLLDGYGERWLVDSGFFSYGRDDPFHLYALSPSAHNLVEVDHKSYFDSYPEARTVDAALQLLTDYAIGPTVSWVRGQHRLNPGVLFRRALEYRRPGGLVVSDDLVAEDGQEHDYVLYWHIAAGKVITATGETSFLVTTAEPSGPTMELTISGSSPVSCQVIIGADDPYQGWYFPGFLQALEAPVIACSQAGKNTSFLTEVVLRPAR